jgi:hypothetical protein
VSGQTTVPQVVCLLLLTHQGKFQLLVRLHPWRVHSSPVNHAHAASRSRHGGALGSGRITMNWNSLRKIGKAGRVATIASIATVLLISSSGTGLANSSRPSSRNALAGAWLVEVTLRNCASGAPLGSFNSLVTFHDGGTISEATSSPAFAVGQRSPGHGNWAFEGHRTYNQRMIALINFDTAANLPGTPGFDPTQPVSPGFFAGWSIVTHTLKLTDRNHATSSGTNEFYKFDGTQYRAGCSTAVATRFE